jgi:TPR repeat protein
VENGDTAAEILLANHYASGDGVEKNCDQARVLLQAAAKRGSDAAAKRLKQLADAGCQ